MDRSQKQIDEMIKTDSLNQKIDQKQLKKDSKRNCEEFKMKWIHFFVHYYHVIKI